MAFEPLFKEKLVQITSHKDRSGATAQAKKDVKLGCENCPSSAYHKKGIKPIFGKVRGKKLFIIAQNPGPDENKEGKELVGKSGQWLWKEFKKVGISREDCDIQNAVRCFTVSRRDPDTGRWIMRAPDKEEIKCCSLYTRRALEKSRAKVYIVFGALAAKQVFGGEFRKDRRVFWSEKLDAKVYCLDHPSYFVRGGSSQRLDEFREGLRSAAAEVKGKSVSRFAHIEAQDYKWLETNEEARKEARLIRRAGRKGIRVSFDDEHDHDDKTGESYPIMMGTCFKPGRVRQFSAKHKHIVASLLEDKRVPKVMHHGVSDAKAGCKLWGAKKISNFKYDTEIAEFFRDTDKYSYGLKSIIDERYKQFSGYQAIIMPYAAPKNIDELNVSDKEKLNLKAVMARGTAQQQYDVFRRKGMLRYGQIPKDLIRLYNGVDADIGKRVELSTKKHVSLPLMGIYVDASMVLDDMEHNGPFFDFAQYKRLKKLYPPRLAKALKYLKKIGGESFNPQSPVQVKHVVYEVLKLEYPFPLEKGEKPNTRKNTLEMLARKNKFCEMLLKFRKLSKIVSTYLDSFAECARANKKRLRTKWWLTGTRTGRLSSGGTKGESELKVVNLQNIHGDPFLQDQAIADRNWREVYKASYEKLKSIVGEKLLNKLARHANDKDTVERLQDKIRQRLKKAAWDHALEEILKAYGDTKVFLGFDFGQIEVRVMAQLSGDENLIEDCKSGDIHSMVGHAMTGWPIEKIKKDKQTRTLTKNIHFGILFGLGPDGVYRFIVAKDPDTTITPELALKYYNAYFARYPKVKKFVEKIRAFAEEHGYVENMFGFRRKLNVHSSKPTSGEEDFGEESGSSAYWGNQAINCVDFKTEALTQRGWIRGDDLQKGDVLLTKNPANGHLEWQSATAVKVYPKAKVPLILWKSRSFNAASTLDHRWLVDDSKCMTTAELMSHGHHKIHRTGKYIGPGGSKYSDDLIRLIGWVLTDGHGAFKRGKGYNKHGVGVCQSPKGNPEKCKEIDALFKRLKKDIDLYHRVKLPKNRDNKEGLWWWHFSGPWGAFITGKFPDRCLTPDFLAELPKRQIQILFETMMLGDGFGFHLEKYGKLKLLTASDCNNGGFCCKHKKQIDSFQMMCMLLGIGCSVTLRDMSRYQAISNKMANIPKMTKTWYAKLTNRRKIENNNLQHKIIENTGVWCPIVPNTYFVARREGQMYITGNTPVQGSAHQLMLMAIAALKRKKKTYKLLGVPPMEVHDALYFFVKLKNLVKAISLGKHLLEKEPINTVHKEFPKIDWKMPLQVEAKQGFRLGDTIEGDDSLGNILRDMVLETYTRESQLKLELQAA